MIYTGVINPQNYSKYLDLGNKYLLEQNYEETMLDFKKAIKIDDKTIDTRVGLAKVCIGINDINSAGLMLFKCMISLLVFEILNIFIFVFGLFDMILSGAGIAIYSGYTLYVMKGMQLKCFNELFNEYDIVKISLYLITSLLNLLLQLLILLAAIKNND